jgi:hypothetical protein
MNTKRTGDNDNNNNNIIHINPLYIKYRRLWKDERWKFSGELVRLTIKENNGNLNEYEEEILKVMNRILEEFDNNWTDGFEVDENGWHRSPPNNKKR